MKQISAADIASFLEREGISYRFVGDPKVEIQEIANIKELKDSCLSWIKNASYLTEPIKNAVLSHKDILLVTTVEIEGAACILTDDPKRTFFSILNHFFPVPRPAGISPSAEVRTDRIGRNVSIGAHCYIGSDVEIGDDVCIHHNVVIECPCKIGKGTEIFSGTVIGADGFGYYKNGEVPVREPHYRGVAIGEFVDIGANTCIDRGLLSDTVIGNHVKIDNLCHIAHNACIEDNVEVVAGTILCGSAVIKRNSYVAPGAAVLNQKTVGEGSCLGMGAIVLADVEAGQTVFGVPARAIRKK